MVHMVGDANSSVRTARLRRKGKPAQAMTEFALVFPVLLLIIFAIFEGGRLLFVYSSIAAAGREAARFGAGIGQTGSTALYNDCNGIRAAAVRMGSIAGISAGNIHIFHDNGPGTTSTEYCTSANPTIGTISEGDRISIKIDTNYIPLEPLFRVPILSLHSQSSHTILAGVEVIAATPQSLPNIFTCPITAFTITEDTPTGPAINVKIVNTGSPITLDSLVIVWDTQTNPLLINIYKPPTTPMFASDINVEGPVYSHAINWLLPTNIPSDPLEFKIVFSGALKHNVIIRLSYKITASDGEIKECSFGK